MSLEIGLVLAILVVAVLLFATEWLRVDAVALAVLAALLVLQLVSPREALSGFSNQATITVAAMFVLSAGLQKTGALLALARMLTDLAHRRIVYLVVMMAAAAVASAFINNTPVVAVMIPLVMGVAARHKVSPSHWLIPLSYASQFGGVCTLIGTSTNLLVNAVAEDAGYGSFGMFEFSRLGLVLFAVGVAYFLILGRHLLPDRPSRNLAETYQLHDYTTELRVLKGSPLVGQLLKDIDWFSKHDVEIVKLLRKGRALRAWRRAKFKAGDVLLVQGDIKDLMNVREARGLELNPRFRFDGKTEERSTTLVEALVAPRSRLNDKTLSELSFRRKYRLVVLGLQRRGQTLLQRIDRVHLRTGDAMLLQGSPREIERLRRDDEFIVLEEKGEAHFFRGRAPLAVSIIAAVVLAAAFTGAPIVATALVGAVAMVVTGCLRIEDAYDAIDWRVIFLLAGILPLGTAMTTSGAAEWLVDHALALLGDHGPVVALAALYLLTAVLTEAMSNNAAAILMAPIAVSTAVGLGVDPRPFLIAITFAASTAFATPVGYQTNTMIYNPGGYKYADFMRVGIPLNLAFWVLAVWLIPRFWPF